MTDEKKINNTAAELDLDLTTLQLTLESVEDFIQATHSSANDASVHLANLGVELPKTHGEKHDETVENYRSTKVLFEYLEGFLTIANEMSWHLRTLIQDLERRYELSKMGVEVATVDDELLRIVMLWHDSRDRFRNRVAESLNQTSYISPDGIHHIPVDHGPEASI